MLIVLKKYLITGGTGSWGHALVEELLKGYDTGEIIIYSRNEYLQVMMARQFTDPRVKFVIGDVCDYETLKRACKNVNIIYHLAALKHVPLCEENTDQCVKTNIYGTQNVIRCAIECGVDKVIDVSSDKAAAPNNIYGMCKAVGEKLILNANKYGKTKFVCIRGGNVLGSNGSVCQLFIDQIRKDNKIWITHPEMTRFFLTLPQAIKLLLVASDCIATEGLYVMKMPSCLILDLAYTIGKHFGDEATSIMHSGIRPGEKLHEVLLTEHECMNAYQYGEDYYVVSYTNLNLPKVNLSVYGSNTQPLMNQTQIEEMLVQGGFL